jgi:type II secretory pathway component PulM
MASFVEPLRGRFEEVIGNLSPRDRTLLGVMIAVALIFVLGGGFWYGQGTLADLRSRIADKESKLTLLKSMKMDQDAAAEQIRAIEDKLRQSAGQDLPSFVERAAQKVGIAANLQVREKGVTVDGNLEEKSFQVEVNRINLQQLNDFLHEVETGGYPLQVRGSKVRATAANGQKVLNVTLDVAAFKLVEEESSTTEEKTP